MTSGVEGWLAGRLQDVPGDFLAWLEPEGGELLANVEEDAAKGRTEHRDGRDGAAEGEATIPADVAPELARRGLEALSEAVARPGRDREAAFRLLAADAYLTYACEAILEGAEPERELRELIRRIGVEAE